MIAAFLNCVESAFHRSKKLLWPINSKVWLKLALLLFLSGSLGGNYGFNIPGIPSGKPESDKKEVTAPAHVPEKIEASIKEWKNKTLGIWQKYRPYAVAALVAAVTVVLLLFLFMMWLSSRLQMVLLRGLSTGTIAIRDTWRQTHELGQSLFKFNLVLSLSYLICFGLGIGGIGWGIYKAIKSPGPAPIVSLVIMGIGLAVVVIVMAALAWIIYRFMPVVMEVRNVSALSALTLMMRWVKENFLKALVYFFLYAVFAFGISMMVMMLAVIIGLVVAAVFFIGGLGVWALIKGLSVVFKAVVVTIGALVLVVMVFGAVVFFGVPTGTFFTYLRMELVRSS